MNVLSLFDGMSCGQIALNRAGVKYSNYYASEVDKYAIEVCKKNYPETIHLGDVKSVKSKDLPKVDLLIGGSPCQGFSSLRTNNEDGKKGFAHDKSILFWEYVRLLKELKPKYFLLENVSMKKEYLDIITDELNEFPIEINSALFSYASRKRLYWTNLKKYPIIDKELDASEFIPGYVPMSFGDLKTKKMKRTSKYGCLTASMYKGCRSAGHPTVCKPHCEGKSFFELEKNKDYRMLTPEECELLQTVPTGYTSGVSNTQRYKMLGNGWTVDVIAHLFRELAE